MSRKARCQDPDAGIVRLLHSGRKRGTIGSVMLSLSLESLNPCRPRRLEPRRVSANRATPRPLCSAHARFPSRSRTLRGPIHLGRRTAEGGCPHVCLLVAFGFCGGWYGCRRQGGFRCVAPQPLFPKEFILRGFHFRHGCVRFAVVVGGVPE